jgi:hypothetical protein
MKKSDLNSKLRNYARQLSPTTADQDLIGKVYQSLNDLFGVANCIQIGSYPRFTAITPIHDLDVLYVLGQWDENNHSPEATLKNLYEQLISDYVNPTDLTVKISFQTHSVTIEYLRNTKLMLSVDIVPAYTFSTNEYELPTYKVPEVIKQGNHEKRHATPWSPDQDDGWIHSDPRGYISAATAVGINTDFRKAVKIAKNWKNRLKAEDEKLKLKSFHLEQVITAMFQEDPSLDLSRALFDFFLAIPDTISKADQIADRANPDKFIDDYIKDLTQAQKDKIILARTNVLIALEQLDSSTDIASVFEPNFSEQNPDEQFMFDHGIPVHHDESNSKLQIDFDETTPNRAQRRKAERRKQPVGNKLYFKIAEGYDAAMTYFWKVKNSDLLDRSQRRGEITEGSTKNDPENTQYLGSHYVECYAVDADGICTDRARVDVHIGEEHA